MDAEEVTEYVRRSRRVVGSDAELDEQNTKVKLVQPLIRLLGWDIYSEEVELEHPVQIGTRRTRVDYALNVDGSPAMFVEAKACRDDVSESDVRQLQSYMRQEIAVEWGLLTNGRTFEVLKEADEGRSEEMTVATFDLDDLAATPHVLDLLTRDSIGSGRSTGIAEQVAQRDDAIRRLQRNRQEVADAIGETLSAELGEDPPVDVERRVEAFLDDLVTALEEQRTAIGPVATGGGNVGGGDGGEQVGLQAALAGVADGGRSNGGSTARAGTGGQPSRRGGTGTGGPNASGSTGGGTSTAGALSGRGSGSRDRQSAGGREHQDGWVPAPETGVGVGTVSRADVGGDPGATVAMVPVEMPGFEFDDSDVWKTATVAGDPAFLAMHVGGSRGDIRYVGRVRGVVPVEEAARDYSGKDVRVGDQVVRFEPGSVCELDDPIPTGSRRPRTVRYTDLGSFRRAITTDDLL